MFRQFSKSNTSPVSAISTAAFLSPLVILLTCAFGLSVSGCGGGGPVYVAGPPCAYYAYGCPYGYGAISTFAGTGLPGNSGNGAPAVTAQLEQPVAVAVDTAGNLFIADRASNAVREVAASTGLISNASSGPTSAVPGSRPSFSSHIAVGANFHQPSAVAIDPSGRVYILDEATSTVRRFSASTAALTLVAGNANGRSGYSGDNCEATAAQLNHPRGMAFDRSGNLFIADTLNHRIRKLAVATGRITTVAGTGRSGYAGDGGPAAAAQLSRPTGIATDSKGNLYIADAAAAVIRKVDARTRVISTVAGTGVAGFSGDNAPAAAAQLNDPEGISADTHGNLFIADTGNQRVREVAVRNGIITTIAGDRIQGYSGDGHSSSRAELNKPYATAIDAGGNLYIADSANGDVRKVLPNPQTAPNGN